MKDSLAKFIDRIAEAINFLDFSYIISGSVGLMIATFILHNVTNGFDDFVSKQPNCVIVVSAVICAYVIGLIMGSLGACIRQFLCEPFYFNITKEIKNCNEVFKRQRTQNGKEVIDLDNSVKSKINTTILWTELSTKENCSERLAFINRFWVMQKMYEGLFADFLVCSIAIIVMSINNDLLKLWPCILVVALFLVASLLMAYEANKNARTQIREIIALYYVGTA